MDYPAGTVPQAEGLARDLRSRVPGCGASWLINAPGLEWVGVFARPTAEVEPRRTRQLVHVVPLVPNELVADILSAACGAVLPRAGVEFLAGICGMPCEPCAVMMSALTGPCSSGPLPQRRPGATRLPAPVHFDRSPAVLARVLDGLSALGLSGVEQC